jgi:hypothetical protein
VSSHQNEGQNHEVKLANRCFGNVAQSRFLGTAITNRNLIQEGFKRRLNSGNAYYLSYLLCSRLLSKNINLEYTQL